MPLTPCCSRVDSISVKTHISNKVISEILGAHEFLGDTIQPSAENYNGTYCIGQL